MKEEANKVSKEDKKDSSEEKKAKKAKKSDGKTKTDESSSKAKGRKADAMGEVGADAEKKPRTEKRGKKREAEDEGTKSKLAEAEKRTINSSTHHKEWQAYKRWIKNKKRFPASLATRVQSEEGRNSLFKDYVENEGDTAKITAKHLQSLEEKSSNECRYGFRSEKWIHDQHGTDKGNKIIQRKKEQGLYVEDPECPGENLWFVLISLDVSNVQQFKKITSMEISGAASPEVLKAFTDQGGVLSGEGLKGATTSDGAMKKAVGFMQTACGGSGKKPRKPKGGDNKEEDGKGGEKVVAKTWEEKAGALITKILRDANTCRDNAFKLKPLEMSSELIKHLKAVEIQLQRAASKLQDLVNKGCKKGKHYQPIVDEVDQLTQLAKEKIQLAKALVRAAENAKKTDKKEVKENEKTEKPTGPIQITLPVPELSFRILEEARGHRWSLGEIKTPFFIFGDLWWYERHSHLDLDSVEIPYLKEVVNEEGDTELKLVDHKVAILWPWDVFHFMDQRNALEGWIADKPEKASLKVSEYWHKVRGEDFYSTLQLTEPERTVPIVFHVDGVRIYKQQESWIYSYSSMTKKGGSTVENKIVLCLVRDALVAKPQTHDALAKIVACVCTVLQTGRYPCKDFYGQDWPAGSKEAERANSEFASGWRGAFSAFKGDLQARVMIHKLCRNYMANLCCEHDFAGKLLTYGDFGPAAAWKHTRLTHSQFIELNPPNKQTAWVAVPGWRKERNLDENRVPYAPLRFNLARFGKESWGEKPELTTQYKAMIVKHLIYWSHAWLTEEGAESDILCTSYALAQFQYKLDTSPDWLSPNDKRETVDAGFAFLQFYQRLAFKNLRSPKQQYKLTPKFHYFCHLVEYIDKSARNVRYEHCYADESLMGQMARICNKCHALTLERTAMHRYRVMLDLIVLGSDQDDPEGP
ncbi:Uncharacterized protein SCF082_LOCUS43560 [Durusdinium trenchii]|uniref:Uncharacterized protein n=1 Tax=Durusdinium trenchii TaxID=1381693 RepID=A0ABP0QWF3_9DINO